MRQTTLSSDSPASRSYSSHLFSSRRVGLGNHDRFKPRTHCYRSLGANELQTAELAPDLHSRLEVSRSSRLSENSHSSQPGVFGAHVRLYGCPTVMAESYSSIHEAAQGGTADCS